MSEQSSVDRRTVLKTITGAGATAALGGGALLTMTGGAAAKAVLSANISGTTYSGDEGDLDWVGADVEKVLYWDGFDVPLEYINFRHEITLSDGGTTNWHVLYDDMTDHLENWSSDGDGSDGWGGPGEYIASYTGDKQDGLEGEMHANVHWAIISDGTHPPEWDSVQKEVDWTATLSEGVDGESNTTTVKWKTTLEFYTEDADGNPVQISPDDGVAQVVGEDTFDVKVTNEIGDTSGSGETGTTSSG